MHAFGAESHGMASGKGVGRRNWVAISHVVQPGRDLSTKETLFMMTTRVADALHGFSITEKHNPYRKKNVLLKGA